MIFLQKISKKVRTPQACARALKGEQEITASNNRVLRITLPDPVVESDAVKAWSGSIESVLFKKPLEARHFTVVLSSGSNVKKEIEKLTKVSVGGGKIKVKEMDPAETGHNANTGKNPVELIDPYTL